MAIATFNEIVLLVDDPFSLNQHRLVIFNLALVLKVGRGDHFVQTHHQISSKNLVVENYSFVEVSENNWESFTLFKLENQYITVTGKHPIYRPSMNGLYLTEV